MAEQQLACFPFGTMETHTKMPRTVDICTFSALWNANGWTTTRAFLFGTLETQTKMPKSIGICTLRLDGNPTAGQTLELFHAALWTPVRKCQSQLNTAPFDSMDTQRLSVWQHATQHEAYALPNPHPLPIHPLHPPTQPHDPGVPLITIAHPTWFQCARSTRKATYTSPWLAIQPCGNPCLFNETHTPSQYGSQPAL